MTRIIASSGVTDDDKVPSGDEAAPRRYSGRHWVAANSQYALDVEVSGSAAITVRHSLRGGRLLQHYDVIVGHSTCP